MWFVLFYFSSCWISVTWVTVMADWRHNDHDGVSNHQPRGCLLNRLYRRRSKKTSKLRVTGLCAGNSPGPVTRKMFHLMTSSCDGHRCRWGELSLTSWVSKPRLNSPDSKIHGANMGPIWGRQDPGGPHVGPMNFAIWVIGQHAHNWHLPYGQCMVTYSYNYSIKNNGHVLIVCWHIATPW